LPLLTFLTSFKFLNPFQISRVSGFDYEMKENPYFQKDGVLIEESVDRFLLYGGKWSKIQLRNKGVE